jgi:hypothetical protein
MPVTAGHRATIVSTTHAMATSSCQRCVLSILLQELLPVHVLQPDHVPRSQPVTNLRLHFKSCTCFKPPLAALPGLLLIHPVVPPLAPKHLQSSARYQQLPVLQQRHAAGSHCMMPPLPWLPRDHWYSCCCGVQQAGLSCAEHGCSRCMLQALHAVCCVFRQPLAALPGPPL